MHDHSRKTENTDMFYIECTYTHIKWAYASALI